MRAGRPTHTWLCRDDARRDRALDMEVRLKPVRALTMALIALALLITGPWLGWWPIGLAGVALGGFVFADRQIFRQRRPEFVIGGAWLLSQALIAVAILLTGAA